MTAIAHMDLDTFFVSVERLMDSRLNDKTMERECFSDLKHQKNSSENI